MVPTFSRDSTAAECEAEIEKMCRGHNAVNVWKAICDMHPSEKTGQAQEDVHRNTAGKWLLCEFMVIAGHECEISSDCLWLTEAEPLQSEIGGL